MKRIWIALILFLALTASLAMCGSEEETPVSDYSIDNLQWLVGHWTGDGFGGICEEVWSPASGGTMVGTFKLTVDGSVRFYEIMAIVPDSAGPKLLVKHFNPDLTGWEEKDEVATFEFKEGEDGKVVFGGLTYEKIDHDHLNITITMSHKDGPPTYEILKCTRTQ